MHGQFMVYHKQDGGAHGFQPLHENVGSDREVAHMIRNKRIVILAGPNGAGKSTFASKYLASEANVPTFLNADVIAADLNPLRPDLAAIQAGRMMLSQIDECVSRGESFAIETTLSGRGFARAIPSWREQGYWIKLYFLRLPTPEACITRVRQRVREGGHDIPEAVIHRRFHSGWRNFESIYRSRVDEWVVYNMSEKGPILVSEGVTDMNEQVQKQAPRRYVPSAEERKRDSERAMAALRSAAREAQRRAIETTGSFVVYRDGKLVHIYSLDESTSEDSDVARD